MSLNARLHYQLTLDFFKTQLTQDSGEAEPNSIGYVVNHLELKHMRAWCWLYEHFSTDCDAYNLHNLIVHWDSSLALVKFNPAAALDSVADVTRLPPNIFNPSQLMLYFCENPQ